MVCFKSIFGRNVCWSCIDGTNGIFGNTMNKGNKVTLILFLIFVVINLVDGITATYILPGESNPLFLMSGSLFSIYILKILMTIGLGYFTFKNQFPSQFYYFAFIVFLL